MMDFLRENFQLICLMLGILGVLIGVFSLVKELPNRKKKNNR
jgi:hypothetical protein